MKQTAVEWLEYQLYHGIISGIEAFEQAKAIEKEQREKDLESGFHVGRLYQGREGDTTLEQLKERTFKSE